MKSIYVRRWWRTGCRLAGVGLFASGLGWFAAPLEAQAQRAGAPSAQATFNKLVADVNAAQAMKEGDPSRQQAFERLSKRLNAFYKTFPASPLVGEIRYGRFTRLPGQIDRGIFYEKRHAEWRDLKRKCTPRVRRGCATGILSTETSAKLGTVDWPYDREQLVTALTELVRGDQTAFEAMLRDQGPNLEMVSRGFALVGEIDWLGDMMAEAQLVLAEDNRTIKTRDDALVLMGRSNRDLRTPALSRSKRRERERLCEDGKRMRLLSRDEYRRDGLFPASVRVQDALCDERPVLEPVLALLKHGERRMGGKFRGGLTPTRVFRQLEAFDRLEDGLALAMELVDTPKPPNVNPPLAETIRVYAIALLVKAARERDASVLVGRDRVGDSERPVRPARGEERERRRQARAESREREARSPRNQGRSDDQGSGASPSWRERLRRELAIER